MTPRIILRKLRQVARDITTEVDSPNYGGCCVIAAAMGAALERVGVDVECITRVKSICDVSYNSPAQVRHLVIDSKDDYAWISNGVSFHHVAIRFRLGKLTYTWDSDTGPLPRVLMFGADRMIACLPGEGLTVEEARILGMYGEWNLMFNRDQIPLIHEIINRYFPKGTDNV